MKKSNPELEFISNIKQTLLKMVSFKCLDQLKDFNDCRETGLKKNKKLKSIQDEEVKYYEVTKGCYDEYQCYFKCIDSNLNEILDQKEIKNLFKQRNPNLITRKELKDIILKDYKLI